MSAERALLTRIGAVTVDGVPVRDIALKDGTRWFQQLHHHFFDIEIPRYLAGKSVGSSRPTLGLLISYLFVLKVSVLGVLWAVIARPKVLIFSSDKVSDHFVRADFRIAHLYKLLEEKKVRYQEILHTAFTNGSVYSHYWKRRRPTLYLEAIDALWFLGRWCSAPFRSPTSHIFGNLPEDEAESAFIVAALEKYLRVRGLKEFRVRVLRAVFRMVGYTMVSSIDDTRHYHEVVRAARAEGIYSCALQHGHFTQYHVGWLPLGASGPFARADELLVWSQYWKQELVHFGSVYPEESIKIVGGSSASLLTFATKSSKTTVLVPFETVAPNDEVGAFLARVSTCPNTEVYLKVRPDIPVERQLDAYPEVVRASVNVATSLAEVPYPDLCLGVYSTFLYDMVSAGVPVGILQTSMEYGEGMVRNGLATPIFLEGVCESVALLEVGSGVERYKNEVVFKDAFSRVLEQAGVV